MGRTRCRTAKLRAHAPLLALLSCGLPATLVLGSGSQPPSRSSRPHLLAVLADDLGFYDTGLYNSASPTPTLVALSKEVCLIACVRARARRKG